VSRSRPVPALVACLIATACGAAVAPSSLVQLEAEWAAVDADRLAEAAPEASREAADWLAQAREAMSAGEIEDVERFAGLGAIALRTAALHQRRLAMRERIGRAESELAELSRERERLESAIELARREDERRRLRAHLAAVVDEERRRAAADDELRDATLAPEEREALEGARLAIAAELDARARVALAALLAFIEAGLLISEQAIPVIGDIDRAGDSVAAGDLASAEEHFENAGVLVRQSVDDVFAAGGADFPVLVAGLLAAIRSVAELADLAAGEELGIGLSLAVRFTAKGAVDRRSASRIEETARALRGLPGIAAVLVVAAHGTGPTAPAAAARADGHARVVADTLRPLLAGGERAIPVLSVTGVGGGSPIAALRGKAADRVGLLLLPLPARTAVAP